MACDEELVQRIRVALGDAADLSERRMFGGVCFMLNGHMLCGVVKDEMMVRVGPDNYAKALEAPHARPMDFTGRPMVGCVFVEPPGIRSDTALRQWVTLARRFVEALPPKKLTSVSAGAASRTLRKR